MAIEVIVKYKDCYGAEHLTLEEAQEAQNRGIIREYLKSTKEGVKLEYYENHGRGSGISMSGVARIIYENRKNLVTLLKGM